MPAETPTQSAQRGLQANWNEVSSPQVYTVLPPATRHPSKRRAKTHDEGGGHGSYRDAAQHCESALPFITGLLGEWNAALRQSGQSRAKASSREREPRLTFRSIATTARRWPSTAAAESGGDAGAPMSNPALSAISPNSSASRLNGHVEDSSTAHVQAARKPLARSWQPCNSGCGAAAPA